MSNVRLQNNEQQILAIPFSFISRNAIKGANDLLREYYLISQQMMSMVGIYDRRGKLCTLVRETSRTFFVDRSPLAILDDSIRRIGYDLRGATSTAKKLLGDVHMCPVMVNPVQRIVLFPTKSPKHADTIWLNPNHMKRTTSCNRMTLVRFSNGSCLLIAARLSSLNTKIQNAEQLEDMTSHVGNKTVTFVIDPKKRRIKKK